MFTVLIDPILEKIQFLTEADEDYQEIWGPRQLSDLLHVGKVMGYRFDYGTILYTKYESEVYDINNLDLINNAFIINNRIFRDKSLLITDKQSFIDSIYFINVN